MSDYAVTVKEANGDVRLRHRYQEHHLPGVLSCLAELLSGNELVCLTVKTRSAGNTVHITRIPAPNEVGK